MNAADPAVLVNLAGRGEGRYSMGMVAWLERGSVRFLRRDFRNVPARLWLRMGGSSSISGKLDYPRDDIYLQLSSRAELPRLNSCSKEPWTINWIEEYVQDGDVFYDIGANVGAYSLVAAKSSQGRSDIVALEPAYANFSALCTNIVLNEHADDITPLPVALSSQTTPGTFRYSSLEPGTANHTVSDTPCDDEKDGVYDQQMLTYRLDDLIRQFSLPRPNHAKLDVDGSEVEVLKGAAETLHAESFRSLMVEVAHDQTDEVFHQLTEHGLRLQDRFDRPSAEVWYGLFVR